jgi:hypothetical protein
MNVRTLISFLVVLLSAGAASALPRTTETVAQRSVSLRAGWESTWVTVVGYGVGLPNVLGSRGTVWQTDLVVPVSALPSLKAGTGLNTLFGPERGFGVGALARLELAWALDATGTKVGLGAHTALRPGYYDVRWSVAADLGWRSNLLTFLAHSDDVETLFEDRYPEGAEADATDGPRDGFIGPQANRLQGGVAGALRLSDAAKLTLRGGFEWTPTAQGFSSAVPVRPLPFYTLLGGAFRW